MRRLLLQLHSHTVQLLLNSDIPLVLLGALEHQLRQRVIRVRQLLSQLIKLKLGGGVGGGELGGEPFVLLFFADRFVKPPLGVLEDMRGVLRVAPRLGARDQQLAPLIFERFYLYIVFAEPQRAVVAFGRDFLIVGDDFRGLLPQPGYSVGALIGVAAQAFKVVLERFFQLLLALKLAFQHLELCSLGVRELREHRALTGQSGQLALLCGYFPVAVILRLLVGLERLCELVGLAFQLIGLALSG